MDLVSTSSGITNQYSTLYNSFNQKTDIVQANSSVAKNQNTNGTSNIILVKKGSTGYMTDVDFDDDGKITLDEFNKYCEENGVNDKDKMKLMTTMEFSKVKEQLIKENTEKTDYDQNKENKSTEKEEDSSIYAKKGDDKYNESMDTNNDSIVTYEEYVKFCIEQAQKNDNSSSKENNKYNNTDEKDLVTTVEFEV